MKPYDIFILCKILSYEREKLLDSSYNQWTYQQLSEDIQISKSQCFSSVKRLMDVNLWVFPKGKKQGYVVKDSAIELLVHGIKYMFPVKIKSEGRGVGTAHSSPKLKDLFVTDINYVWSYFKGKQRGLNIPPFHESCVEAALKDDYLYFLLSLIDMIRVGKARDRKLGTEMLTKSIKKNDFYIVQS